MSLDSFYIFCPRLSKSEAWTRYLHRLLSLSFTRVSDTLPFIVTQKKNTLHTLLFSPFSAARRAMKKTRYCTSTPRARRSWRSSSSLPSHKARLSLSSLHRALILTLLRSPFSGSSPLDTIMMEKKAIFLLNPEDGIWMCVVLNNAYIPRGKAYVYDEETWDKRTVISVLKMLYSHFKVCSVSFDFFSFFHFSPWTKLIDYAWTNEYFCRFWENRCA